jgi:quercetin dioxygenase-like cupin family protein
MAAGPRNELCRPPAGGLTVPRKRLFFSLSIHFFWRTHTMPTRFTRPLMLLALLAAAGFAQAGTCPADKVAANTLPGAATAPLGVTDTELSSVALANENVKLKERRLRFRHMTIAPGGIVPLHSHEDRPALIMVNSGEIYEYSSKCAEPILHKAGDIAREFMGTKHWWKNTGNAPVELMIADIVNDKKPETMMEHM